MSNQMPMKQVKDDKENIDKENIDKEIYTFLLDSYNQHMERKRHIEIKILYLLQATAILITLFLGLVSQSVNAIESIKININEMVFYCSIAVALITLTISLVDTLLNHGRLSFDIDVGEFVEQTKDIDSRDQIYQMLIPNIKKTIESIVSICKVKNRLLCISIFSITIAIGDLVIIGFKLV